VLVAEQARANTGQSHRPGPLHSTPSDRADPARARRIGPISGVSAGDDLYRFKTHRAVSDLVIHEISYAAR